MTNWPERLERGPAAARLRLFRKASGKSTWAPASHTNNPAQTMTNNFFNQTPTMGIKLTVMTHLSKAFDKLLLEGRKRGTWKSRTCIFLAINQQRLRNRIDTIMIEQFVNV